MNNVNKNSTILQILFRLGMHTYFVSQNGVVRFIAFAENTDKRIYLIPVPNLLSDGYSIGQVYFSETKTPVRLEVWYTGYLPKKCHSPNVIRQFLQKEKACARRNQLMEAGSYIYDSEVYRVAFRLWLDQEKYRIQEVFLRHIV